MDREFVIGVQWHAETLQIARPEQAALFVRLRGRGPGAATPGATRLRVA